MTSSTTVREEIELVMDRYFTSYEKFEFDVCRSIWDFEHENISLKPTEIAEPLTTADQISEYFDANFNIELEIWRPTNIRIVDPIRDDVVFVFTDMVCRFKTLHESPHFPAGSEVRWKGVSSFIFHKKDGDWRLIHYEDSTPWNLENIE